MNPHPFKSYLTYVERLITFQGWKYDDIQNREHLALAGFEYKGPDDTVLCRICGIALYDWKLSDLPVNEHAKYSKGKCAYLELIGINYVTSPFIIGRVDKNNNVFSITTNQQQPHSGYSGGFRPPRSSGFVEFNGFKPPQNSGCGMFNGFLQAQNSNITTANHQQQQPLLGYKGGVQPPQYSGFNGFVQSQISDLTTVNLQQNHHQPFSRSNGEKGYQPARYSGFDGVHGLFTAIATTNS